MSSEFNHTVLPPCRDQIVPQEVDSLLGWTAIRFAALMCAFLSGPSILLAQLHSLDVSQYLHTSWTAQDGYFRGIGVSNNGIAQTRDGYIWFLSTTGIFRFDGARFVEWKPPNGESFPGAPPSQMLAARDGSLWIAGHGVAEIRADGTWHRYHELDALTRVRLAEDKDGVIWVGAEISPAPNGFSLFRIDHGKVDSYKLPEFAGLGFTPLFVDSRGRLWADTERGIWQILPGPPKLIHEKTSRTSAFSEDSAGELLYPDAGRIWKLSSEGPPEDYLGKLETNPLNIRALFCDKEGGLWIGTMGQGIVHLHEGRIDHFTSLDGLSSDDVETIFQDQEGNVWVTSPDSIDKFTKPAVPRLTRKQGLSGDSVYSVLTDRLGRTWIGTSNGFNELAADNVSKPIGQFHNDPGFALIQTRTGRILMTTMGRNQVMGPDHRRMISDRSDMVWLEGYKNVFSFAEDGEGTLWAVSQELGLLHLRENGELIEAFNDSKWGDYALSVAFDPRRDGIWFTTHNGKVFFLKDGKILERYGHADGIGNGAARVLQVDDDGGVWLATSTGLGHLMNHKVSVLGIQNGLPCDRVHWMRHDQDHQVWLYTGCGLFSFSERDLSAWIAQPSHSVTITDHLDNTEGVQNTAIGGWYTPQSAMTSDGRILFATRTGLGVLDPRHLNHNSLPPQVYIEAIAADGREITNAGHPSLPAKTGTIHIAYTALSFAAPRKVRFRYKLQGYDKDWSEPVSLREVDYTNLPPGDYQFRVIACNNDGVWNETGDYLAFTIPPSFTQSGWFTVICALAVVGLIYLAYHFRVRQVTGQLHARMYERLAERERIARDLHDTFFQGIQGLLLSFNAATSQLGTEEPARRIFEETLKQSDQLMLEGRELVLDLRTTTSEQNDLPMALAGFGESIQKGTGCSFQMVVNGSTHALHEVIFEELLKIGKEALGNAFRHSGAHSIEAELNYERNELRMRIRDDGNGIDPTILRLGREGHFGLPGMRERAKKVGARLDIWSGAGAGTEVELRIAARLAYASEPSGSIFRKVRRLWSSAQHKTGVDVGERTVD
jgi:signal transduction histidine kinase/ligand-binding sensor domain-containing protein